MIYIYLSSVLITLFLIVGILALVGFLDLMCKGKPLTWYCYQHVIVLAVLAAICFIAACLAGYQIPSQYVLCM